MSLSVNGSSTRAPTLGSMILLLILPHTYAILVDMCREIYFFT